MTDPLETLLTGYKNWRDIGNDALIGGLIVEVAVIALISEHWKRKWICELLAGIIVLVGVWIEVKYSGYADEVERQIRRKSNEQIAGLNKEAAKFNREAAQFRKAAADAEVNLEKQNVVNNGLGQILLPREIPSFINMPPFLALNQFAGTKVLIVSVPDLEAVRFAAQISGLLSHPLVKWNVVSVSLQSLPDALNTPDGLSIVTPDVFKPHSQVSDSNSAEQQATSAFMGYLAYATSLQHLPEIRVDRLEYPPRPHWWPSDFNPPSGAICIFVGMKPVKDEIGDVGWINMLPDKLRRRRAQQEGLLPIPFPTPIP